MDNEQGSEYDAREHSEPVTSTDLSNRNQMEGPEPFGYIYLSNDHEAREEYPHRPSAVQRRGAGMAAASNLSPLDLNAISNLPDTWTGIYGSPETSLSSRYRIGSLPGYYSAAPNPTTIPSFSYGISRAWDDSGAQHGLPTMHPQPGYYTEPQQPSGLSGMHHHIGEEGYNTYYNRQFYYGTFDAATMGGTNLMAQHQQPEGTMLIPSNEFGFDTGNQHSDIRYEANAHYASSRDAVGPDSRGIFIGEGINSVDIPADAAPTETKLEIDSRGVPWITFEYPEGPVKRKLYRIRCDIDRIDESIFDEDFRRINCVYPKALVPPEEYKGHRHSYETTCNSIGWKLVYRNAILNGQRGLTQRAVDTYRNTSADVSRRSRKARRLAKKHQKRLDRENA